MGMLSRAVGRVRRPDLPAGAREALELGPRERVLAWAALAHGGWAAGTVRALHVLDPRGRLRVRPWTDVDHAAWDDDSATLAVWWVGSRTPTPLEIDEASFLPEVVHERVRASVVLAGEVDLGGGRRVQVALRKAPDGTLSTSASPGRGVRLADPQVAALVADAVAALRDEAGLTGTAPGDSAGALGPGG